MRIWICVAAAVTVWTAPGAARAEPALAEDLAVVDQCLRDAQDQPEACLGRIEKPCLEEEGGETTIGAVQCARREQAVWAARAEASSKTIRAKLDRHRQKLFSAAEYAWTRHRAATCAYEAAVFEGGSLAKVVAADCTLRMTALRAIDLQEDEQVDLSDDAEAEPR